MDRPKQFEKSQETEVWNAIAAFEEILAAMPDDRTALETLFDAYDHIGDKTQALEYLIRLANQICDDRDDGSMPWVFDSLHRVGATDENAQAASKKIKSILDEMGLPSPADGKSIPQGKGTQRGRIDISSEISLAWELLQAEKVTKDEYSMLVSDVTENSTKHFDVPVSILHVMHSRSFTGIPSVMTFMSEDSTLPLIELSDFEFDREAFSALPMEFSLQKGAIPFSILGEELLVAVLNPYNEELKKKVSDAARRTCHFYLVSAKDYDAYLNLARRPEPSTT